MTLEGPRSKKRRNAESSKFLLMEQHMAAMALRHHHSTIYTPPAANWVHLLLWGHEGAASRALGLWSLWQSSIPSFPQPRGASPCGCTEHLPAGQGEVAPCLSSDEHQKGFWNLQAISHKVTIWLYTPLHRHFILEGLLQTTKKWFLLKCRRGKKKKKSFPSIKKYCC